MPYLIFEEQSYEFSELKRNDPGKHPAMTFCHRWLNGQGHFVLRTSGSTGPPKPISIDRMQMEASAEATIRVLGLHPGDKALVCLNTAYIGGMMMLVRGMVAGMDLLLAPPEGNPLAGLPPGWQPDFSAMVPLQLARALEQEASRRALGQMRALIVGGAPVGQALEERIQMLETPIYSTYGMTETVSHVALRRLNGPERSHSYRLMPEVEVGQDGRGCLRVRGAVTMGKWVQTNDLVRLMPGREAFEWFGRADQVVNTGGIKVPVAMVEEAVEQWMAQAGRQGRMVALGLPHDLLGEQVTLVWEGSEAPNWAQELLAGLHEHLPMYYAPKAVMALEPFPQTPTGKIDREAIRWQLIPNT
jgi:O-succinylbenzoic acid--CoA ligase